MAISNQTTDASKSSSEKGVTGNPEVSQIAELAYLKAEKRGFAPGHEMEDWLEAERECSGKDMENPDSATKMTLTGRRIEALTLL